MMQAKIVVVPPAEEELRWRRAAERVGASLAEWISTVLTEAAAGDRPVCDYCGEPLPPGSTRRRRYHDECKVPAWRASRQPVLTATSEGRLFCTNPAQPGFVEIYEDGERSSGAVAWAGSPIIELDAVEGGVRVRTARSRGVIRRDAKGEWTLQSAERLA